MASKVFLENGQKNITIWISKIFTYSQEPLQSFLLTADFLWVAKWMASLSHFPLQPGLLVHSISHNKVSCDYERLNYFLSVVFEHSGYFLLGFIYYVCKYNWTWKIHTVFKNSFPKKHFLVQCSKNGKIVQYNKCEGFLPKWVNPYWFTSKAKNQHFGGKILHLQQ